MEKILEKFVSDTSLLNIHDICMKYAALALGSVLFYYIHFRNNFTIKHFPSIYVQNNAPIQEELNS